VLQQTEIGRHDNFFDRGGVSLGAIQILGRVQETFGIELPVQTFFNAPTIAAVAQSVEELLISDIESLSDNEVRRLLQEETN
jgi:acyl carrier protein